MAWRRNSTRVREFEFEVKARFQSAERPFVLPVDKTYFFHLSAEAAQRLRVWDGRSTFPLENVRAEVDGQTLDLEIEMNPEAAMAAPGGMLKPHSDGREDEPEPETEQ